jgi:PST family polysaccharide transporter
MSRMGAAIRQLRARTLLRKVVRNTGWQITDKVLRMFLGLLVGLWVARYLGPADFGLLNFAIAFSALFMPVADLGLQVIVVRELVRRPDDRARILSSAVALRLLGAGIAILLACLCALMLRPGDGQSLAMVVIISLSFLPQALDVVEFDYQSRMHPVPVVIVRIVSLVLFAVVKLWLIAGGAPVFWFAAAVFAEAGVSAILFWVMAQSSAAKLRISAAEPAQMRELLRSSWPLAISGLSVILYMRIDQVMLGQMLGNGAVGIFSAAVRISESWYFVPMAIAAAVAPALTAAHQKSEEEYRSKLLAVTRALVWLGVAVALVLTFSADRVILLLYGPGYKEAGAVLTLHAWAGVFAGLGVASGPWFINAGLTRLRMLNTLIGAAANMALNFYVIRRFGVLGAAISTLASYCLAGFVLNALSSRSRPMFWLQLRAFAFR